LIHDKREVQRIDVCAGLVEEPQASLLSEERLRNSECVASFPLRGIVHTVLLNDPKSSRLRDLRIKYDVDIIGKRGAGCGNAQQSDDQGWSKEFHRFVSFSTDYLLAIA
jgi:hypothetical protein